MELQAKKTLLVCPMDWGLGHATRCVPIIEHVLNAGANVVIGADNKPLDFLRLRFPELPWIQLKGYEPEYRKKGPLVLKVATDFPKMMKAVKPVKKYLEQIIRKQHIDAVISDNRYELWSEQVPTVFITHQLNILTQGILAPMRPVIQKFLYSFIEKHNELWIPDFETTPNLSGALSHVATFPQIPRYYIGPLTRFEKFKSLSPSAKMIDVLCIMSGPEPQRTIFEDLIKKQLLQTGYSAVILSGKPAKKEVEHQNNVEILPHCSDEEMATLIRSAKLVVSRSGYTTLMDLATFGRRALFVPTPGQPEQEYLAKMLKESGHFYSTSQNRLNLKEDIPKALHYSGLTMNNKYAVLRERIAALLNK